MKKINAILTISRRALKRKSYDSFGEQEQCNHTDRHDTFVYQHKDSDGQYQGYLMLADTFDNL